jgi:hypothetical protein
VWHSGVASAVKPQPAVGAQEARHLRYVVATIASEQHRILAIGPGAELANDVDWNFGPILGRDKDADDLGVVELDSFAQPPMRRWSTRPTYLHGGTP